MIVVVPCQEFGQPGINPARASVQQTTPASPDPEEATRLSHEVVRLHDERKYDEALPLAKRALELREKALGPDHELVGISLYNVAGIYRAQSRYENAEPLFKRALEILEKKFGPDSEKLTKTLEELGWMRFAGRDNGMAEKMFLRALAIKEKAFGPESLNTAQSLSVLGRFYERTSKPEKAADSFKRALAVREKLLGPNHIDLLEALDDCACIFLLNNRADDGKQYQARATRIRDVTANDPINRQGGVLQGRALLRVEPEYPAAAKQARVYGTVVVQATVDECGRVINAEALSGPKELREAAVSAARGWRFSSARLGTRRVKVIGTITFNFNL